LDAIKLQKNYGKTKPRLEKVEAFLYVLQHITKKEAAQYFDTASIQAINNTGVPLGTTQNFQTPD
jgi:hypothetical protein